MLVFGWDDDKAQVKEDNSFIFIFGMNRKNLFPLLMSLKPVPVVFKSCNEFFVA